MRPEILSVFIALLALGFSVGSFWWIHARSGSLITYPVVAFAGAVSGSEFQVRIPVVIHNSGAAPAVVRAMKLTYVGTDGQVHTMQSQTFLKTIDPSNSHSDFVHAFAVPGRTVETKYVKFLEAGKPRIAPGKETVFVLHILRDENEGWTGLKSIKVHTGLLTGHLLTMSNEPAHWQANTLDNGMRYQTQLLG